MRASHDDARHGDTRDCSDCAKGVHEAPEVVLPDCAADGTCAPCGCCDACRRKRRISPQGRQLIETPSSPQHRCENYSPLGGARPICGRRMRVALDEAAQKALNALVLLSPWDPEENCWCSPARRFSRSTKVVPHSRACLAAQEAMAALTVAGFKDTL